jgi:hypothetical protein
MLVWLLIIFGYLVAAGMALDTAGWDDPVFTIARRMPYTPYSWAALLGAATTVYAVGELSYRQRWRRAVVVIGALLCTAWFAAVAMVMSRMVYELPTRITLLWPFFTFFTACLYASRVIVFTDIFTSDRWKTNPYQLWDTMFLMTVSLSQVIIGVAPGSIFTELERPVQLILALSNLIGATVVIVGLHLRNKDLGLNLEVAGAISLFATLAVYCVSVLREQTLASTTLGFGLAEAFVFATLHRSFQILTLKWARYTDRPQLEQKLAEALHGEKVVVPERDT